MNKHKTNRYDKTYPTFLKSKIYFEKFSEVLYIKKTIYNLINTCIFFMIAMIRTILIQKQTILEVSLFNDKPVIFYKDIITFENLKIKLN